MSDDRDLDWMGPLPAAAGCTCHICVPDPTYDVDDRRTIDAVLRHGWQVLLISDEPGHCTDHHHHEPEHHHDNAGPAFAYTLGLGHRRGHPEVFMSGLDVRLLHHALNEVARRVMAGRRLTPGMVLEDVLAGVPVVVQRLTDEAARDRVTWSGWFHRRHPEAVVLVWPSRSGLFSWQPGAPAELDRGQPAGWREPVTYPDAVSPDPSWPFPVPADHLAFSCTHVVDHGDAVLWVGRESDAERGEDWRVHCGADAHSSEDMRFTHLAHLVRAAPSLREVRELGLDTAAWRDDVHAAWSTGPVG